mgnify:CR=1 FL=1
MLNIKLLANKMKANAKEENPEFETYRAYIDKDTTDREAKDIDFFMTQWITNGYIKIKSSDDAIKYKRVKGKVEKYIEMFKNSEINYMEIIAKEKGIEVIHNKDGTANIETKLYIWENVPKDKFSRVLEIALREIDFE